jgi:hypothetical protein
MKDVQQSQTDRREMYQHQNASGRPAPIEGFQSAAPSGKQTIRRKEFQADINLKLREADFNG